MIVHVSNFRPVKRVDVALEVFRGIRRKIRARFLLIGDGPVREDVERMVAEHGLGGDVLFLGEQHDLVPWLSIADLFLLPSAQESFGLAALEAMACEVPVVASRVGGLPEIIEDGVTGVIVDATRGGGDDRSRRGPSSRPRRSCRDGPRRGGDGAHELLRGPDRSALRVCLAAEASAAHAAP